MVATVRRNLLRTTSADAQAWIDDEDVTRNAMFGYTLGRLTNILGTADAITADLLHGTGFTALQDGAIGWFIPTAANTAAVTLNIGGIGAVPLRDPDGVALAAGTLVSGRATAFAYYATGAEFRLLNPSVAAALSGGIPPMPFVAELLTSSSWVAPWDCYVNIWLFGAGGSGGIRGNTSGARASGGGAAGTAIKLNLFMELGQQLDFVRGAGGAGVTGTDSVGNAGGNSTCVGPNGLSMQANGGGAGGKGTSGTVAGGAGGSATGGDLNITGQAGTAVDTSGGEGSGGIVGLVSTPTAQAANTTTIQHAVTYLVTVASHIGPFTADSALASQTGRGCGTAGDADTAAGTRSSLTAGNGLMVVEYSGAVT